jgi:16S rRNA (uracil1498-N3)-methyltransferase
MATPRFFVPGPLVPDTVRMLPEATGHHAVRVLRLQVSDVVTLFNGNGGEYAAVITAIGRRDVEVKVGGHAAIERESPLNVTLVQAVSSSDRMDLTIQKAVELGVTRIVPVQSERCVTRLKGERARKRVAHWQQIVVSACEQCGRNRVPEVAALLTLENWLAAEPAKVARWLLAPEAEQPLRELPRPQLPVEILVGPEGGFTDTEMVMARRAGYQSLRLGPRVLRTETAAPALLAVLQTLWGDF